MKVGNDGLALFITRLSRNSDLVALTEPITVLCNQLRSGLYNQADRKSFYHK